MIECIQIVSKSLLLEIINYYIYILITLGKYVALFKERMKNNF